MNRLANLSMCVLVIFGSMAASGLAATDKEAQRDADAIARLQKTIDVEFDEVSLARALDYFREVTGANFVVKWHAIEAAGLGKDAPVTLRLKEVKAALALRMVLSNVGGAVGLVFTLDEGVVVISTEDDLKLEMEMHEYDVSAVVSSYDPDLQEKRLATLMETIRTSIEPNSWIANGGVHGKLAAMDNMLVVSHTPKVHDMIGVLLHRLEALKRSAAPTPRERARHTESMVELVEVMRGASFDPTAMGLIAVGGLKEDVARDPAVIAADLEDLLGRIETLGLRNAIRLTLRDLYRQMGEGEKVLAHLRALLIENDKAAAAEQDDDDEDADDGDEDEHDEHEDHDDDDE